MAYNGSGTFNIDSTGQPVVATTLIEAATFNAFTADVGTGLSTAICKDGQTTITANIPFNNKKITGLASATTRTDATNLGDVIDGTGIYIGTVGGTADVITLTPTPAVTAYTAGQTFRFIASGANTTNVTVNISGLGAKALTKNGTTALAANDITSGAMVTMTYDGTEFVLASVLREFLPIVGGTVTGAVSLNSTVSIGGAVQMSSTVTISGAASFVTTVTIAGAVTLKSTCSIGGAVNFGATIAPASLVDLSGASAGQIKFPATQNASSNTNTFDDYEEGLSGTPTLTFATPGNLSVAYTAQESSYVKIGSMVFYNFWIQTSSFTHTTASGALQITGLPFATYNGINVYYTGSLTWSGITKTNYTQVTPQIVYGGASTITFYASGSGQGYSNVTASDCPSGGTIVLYGNIAYRTAT